MFKIVLCYVTALCKTQTWWKGRKMDWGGRMEGGHVRDQKGKKTEIQVKEISKVKLVEQRACVYPHFDSVKNCLCCLTLSSLICHEPLHTRTHAHTHHPPGQTETLQFPACQITSSWRGKSNKSDNLKPFTLSPPSFSLIKPSPLFTTKITTILAFCLFVPVDGKAIFAEKTESHTSMKHKSISTWNGLGEQRCIHSQAHLLTQLCVSFSKRLRVC